MSAAALGAAPPGCDPRARPPRDDEGAAAGLRGASLRPGAPDRRVLWHQVAVSRDPESTQMGPGMGSWGRRGALRRSWMGRARPNPGRRSWLRDQEQDTLLKRPFFFLCKILFLPPGGFKAGTRQGPGGRWNCPVQLRVTQPPPPKGRWKKIARARGAIKRVCALHWGLLLPFLVSLLTLAGGPQTVPTPPPG